MSQEHIDESEDTDQGFLNNIAEWFHRWGKHEGCDAEQAERDAYRLRSIASRLSRPAVEGNGVRLLFCDDLSREEIDGLWDQGVAMDDWDYMLVLANPEEHLVKRVDDDDRETGELDVKNWTLSRLLTGCCSNTWYRAKFRGQDVAIGVAYHA